MREGHCYSDSVVDPKTIWSNKLAVEELIKSWPCNKECFIHIQSHLVTRQTRWRQFGRAQHVGWQGKGWLTVVDMMKLLAGQRTLIPGSNYRFINTTGGEGELKEENNRKESPLLRMGKNQDRRNNTGTHTLGGGHVQVLYFVHMAALVCEQLSLISEEICLMARDHLFSGTLLLAGWTERWSKKINEEKRNQKAKSSNLGWILLHRDKIHSKTSFPQQF